MAEPPYTRTAITTAATKRMRDVIAQNRRMFRGFSPLTWDVIYVQRGRNVG